MGYTNYIYLSSLQKGTASDFFESFSVNLVEL